MAEETCEDPRRRKIVWAGWMLATSGLVILVPYLILGSLQPKGGEGWTSEGMLMVFVVLPISGVLFCAGVITLLVGILGPITATTTKTTDAAIIKKPGRYQG